MKTELVTSLKRRATEIISDLVEEEGPVLITQHGKPAAYLMGVDEYETMSRRLSILEGIARGESAVADGRTYSQESAKQRMSRWLK